MWKVSSKIAHTSMLPALGNKDLRLLQDLITADKSVLLSLQKLAVDWDKANEALRLWGSGEGDDLGDVLNHSSQLLNYATEALNQFASHFNTMRTYLKNIRTKEEQLDDLKRRRRAVGSKADAAEKKLTKMNTEHKGRDAQMDLLSQLREQMRSMDHEILQDEARLGDLKRTTSKDMMVLRLGGLLEFAEKATIIGELGNLLLDEIPLEQTQPGHPRAPYQGYDKTAGLSEEAAQCIRKVQFQAPEPSQAQQGHNRHSSDTALQNTLQAYDRSSLNAPPTLPSSFTGSSTAPRYSQTYSHPIADQHTGVPSEFGETAARPQVSSLGSAGPGPGLSSGGAIRVDDVTQVAGGSFATFPVSRRDRTNTLTETEGAGGPDAYPPSSFNPPHHPHGPSDYSMASTESGPPRLASLDFPAPPGSDMNNPWDLTSKARSEQSPVDETQKRESTQLPGYSLQEQSSPTGAHSQLPPQDHQNMEFNDQKARHHVKFDVPPTPLSPQGYGHQPSHPSTPSPTRSDGLQSQQQQTNDADLEAAAIRDANAAAVRDLTRDLNAFTTADPQPINNNPSSLGSNSLSTPSYPSSNFGSSAAGRVASSSGAFSNPNKAPNSPEGLGARTISAGAFRNVGSKSPPLGPENGGTSPLHIQSKKPLPTSPYPASRGVSGNWSGAEGGNDDPGAMTSPMSGRFGGGGATQRLSAEQEGPPGPATYAQENPYAAYAPSLPPGAQPPQPGHMEDPYGGIASDSHGHEQEIYYTPPAGSGRSGQDDYVGGRPSIGSPVRGDYGMIGNPRVTNSTDDVHESRPDGGYGSGKFATHLDS